MKKILILGFLIIGTSLASCSNENNTSQTVNTNTETNMSVASAETKKAEKIEILLVHGTVRCVSCNAMEEMTNKTLEANFKEEINSGKITFSAINGEDPKNSEIVRKFGATGLSIFINSIIDSKDNIVEEKNLWRYIQNEEQFKSYLTKKLNNL